MSENHVDAKPLKDFIFNRGITYGQAALYIRVSRSTISSWIRLGRMPPWVLRVLVSYKLPKNGRIFVSYPQEKKDTIHTILESLDCKILDVTDV